MGEFRLIHGVMGETVSVPLVRVTLQSSLCSGRFLCGLATKLLGNDLCPGAPAVDVAVVTRSQTAALHREADLQTPLDSEPEISPVEAESDSVDESVEADLASLFESSVAAKTIPFELVDRAELICLQQSDPGLSSLFELAEKGDNHYFIIKSGVLLRIWRDKLAPPESSIHQIVVPASLRPKLLQIAHEIPAAGHLGVAKTQSRLLRHFFWPSMISCDTKSFCSSCDICQRLGKGKKPIPAPLQSMPLVSEPFAQVAIDIVGPVPVCQESGNRFILTVLDLCSHDPEAIALKQHTAADVA